MRLLLALFALLLIGAAFSLRPAPPPLRARVFDLYWEFQRSGHAPVPTPWTRVHPWLPSAGSIALAVVAGSLAVRRR